MSEKKEKVSVFTKIKNIKVDIPILLFSAYIIKLLLLDASFPDAIIIGFLATLVGFKAKVKLLEPQPVSENVKKEIQEIKNALSKVNLSKIKENRKYF